MNWNQAIQTESSNSNENDCWHFNSVLKYIRLNDLSMIIRKTIIFLKFEYNVEKKNTDVEKINNLF